MENNLKRAYFWNTLGSGLNAFNSFFFLIIVTRINGVTEAGIFTLCFAVSNMLYNIAIYSGRTYQVTETEKDITNREYIASRIFLSTIMIIIALLYGVFNGYQVLELKVLILLSLFKITEAVCDVFHGILQKNNRLDTVGISLFLRSFINIVSFLTIDKLTHNMVLSITSLIFINVLIMYFIDIRKSRQYREETTPFKISGVVKILKLGFFTFAFSFIANYLLNAPRFALRLYMDESFQTIFGIIVMPASIVMLVNQFIIQPIITLLKDKHQKNDRRGFIKIAIIVMFATFVTGVLAAIVAYLIGIDVLNFAYKLNLDDYRNSLILVIVGATIYTMTSVLSNCLIVLRKTKIQLVLYSIVCLFAYFISNLFVKMFDFNGAIYAYLLIMILLMILYIITFVIIINNKWERKYK